MVSFDTPRILLSGVSSGVGKSLIGLGLSMAARKRKVSISCMISGPRLLQASIYRRISGRNVRSIDNNLLDEKMLARAAYRAGVGADLILIEGTGGLYDTPDPETLRGSDAFVAKSLKCPVVLVVDGSKFGASLAAVIRGFTGFSEGVDIVGTIANRIAERNEFGESVKENINNSLRSAGFEPLIGAILETELEAELPSGPAQQQENKTLLPRQFLVDIEKLVSEHVDFDQLLELAKGAPAIEYDDIDNEPQGRTTRIAVADDSCFCLTFQDNYELLRYFGAELVSFSPLADNALPPKIGGVYVPGAYLRDYGPDLARNSSMRNSIKEFAANGGAIYSEGSGTAFLSREFEIDGERYEGAGVLNGTAQAVSELAAYSKATTLSDCVLGEQGATLTGYSTGEWKMIDDEGASFSLRVSEGGDKGYPEGYSPTSGAVMTFQFFHWGSNPQVARSFVEAATKNFQFGG